MRKLVGITAAAGLLLSVGVAVAAVPDPDPCDARVKGKVSNGELKAYTDCRMDRLERKVDRLADSIPAEPSATPTPTTSPGSWACVVSGPTDNCGAYAFEDIVNSNGYNTYVSNNCWADPGCDQTISANSPADWQVVSKQPAGNTSVKTYPNVQQLFNNWCGDGVWGACANPTGTPIRALSGLEFSYSLTMPADDTGTIAQAAYDIWTSDPVHSELMIWVDNVNRESGGADFVASHTTTDGRTWSLYLYDGSLVIWSLGERGVFAQQASMSDVPVHELLRYLVDHGYQRPGSLVESIEFGWEICSTGGRRQTFAVTDYSITEG